MPNLLGSRRGKCMDVIEIVAASTRGDDIQTSENVRALLCTQQSFYY